MDEFNWRRAVERYSGELLAIVAQLVAMAGMRFGEIPESLPRGLYFRLLSILRPAEYAARRIIVMAACKLDWQIPAPTSPRLRGEVDLPRAATPGGMANRVRGKNTETGKESTPSFQLFDPNKQFGDPWLTAAEIAALDAPPVSPGPRPTSRPTNQSAQQTSAVASARWSMPSTIWKNRQSASPAGVHDDIWKLADPVSGHRSAQVARRATRGNRKPPSRKS